MSETNEQIDEELSTDDLKSVSGSGLFLNGFKGTNPQGSGSGKTLKEWEKGNKSGEGKLMDLNPDMTWGS